jgi:glycerate dehydrogenase
MPGMMKYRKTGKFKLGEVVVYPRTSDAEKVERAKDADIILLNKVQIDAETLAQLPKLKYIGIQATGFNVVDIEAAKKQGIIVTNIPAYSTDSVAQMTFALILAVTNRVEHYTQENRNERWAYNKDFCYWDTPLMELAGKTLGIMGLGNIGMKVANIARQFGMNICACTSKNSSNLPEWIQKVSKEGLLATSDILSLHCPLSDDTYHFINKESLEKMKDTAILVNTGYGFFFVDRSPSCRYSIPFKIIIEVIFGDFFSRKYNCSIFMIGRCWLFCKSSTMVFL